MKIRSKAFLLIAALAVMVPAFCAVAVELFEPHIPKDMAKTIIIVNQKGEKHDFNVEFALDKEQQAKGLMFVTDMPLASGMLFVFRAAQEHTFWMKDTLIPLDMIFIEGDGKIQHIHSMAKPQDLSRITSGKPSKAVLEINGGLADKLGIEAGDVVYHEVFNNMHRLKD